jgi:hypothetical protein
MTLYCNSVLVLAVIIFVLTPSRASTQEVGLVAPDAKEVAKGYRASALELKSVNDKVRSLVKSTISSSDGTMDRSSPFWLWAPSSGSAASSS